MLLRPETEEEDPKEIIVVLYHTPGTTLPFVLISTTMNFLSVYSIYNFLMEQIHSEKFGRPI